MRTTTEGISSIHNIDYQIDEATGFINVYQFTTNRKENPDTRSVHDLRKGNSPFEEFIVTKKKSNKMKMVFHN